ncbi:MAG: ABC transporter substrate-binding protein [Acidimicrobiia bacterium]
MNMRTRTTNKKSIAVVALMAMAVAACGGGGGSIVDSGSTEAPSTSDGGSTEAPSTSAAPLSDLPPCDPSALESVTGPVEITFWHGMNGELEKSLVALTDEYNASQSKVKVSLENQGGYEQTLDKYLQSGSGSLPDMVQAPEYAVQVMNDTDSNVPVGACIEADAYDTSDFQAKALDQYFTEGVQWAMPFNVSDPVLYYNKKVFEAAGLDPETPPSSLEELRSMSQTIVDSGAAAFGLALDTGADSGGGWFLEQWFAKLGEPFSDNDNGRTAPSTKVLFDSEIGVELLTQLQSLVNDGLAYNVGDNASGQDALLKLADPDKPAAMTIATSAALGTVLSVVAAGTIAGVSVNDIGVGPMPGPGGAPGAIVGGASLWIVDNGDAVKSAATWDFIKFLVSAQTQSTWASATGYVPVRSAALELDPVKTTYSDDLRFRVAYDQLGEAADSPATVGAILGPQREIRNITAQAIATILQGGDVASTLSAAASQANALLADYLANNG